jgi:hypothetical protein
MLMLLNKGFLSRSLKILTHIWAGRCVHMANHSTVELEYKFVGVRWLVLMPCCCTALGQAPFALYRFPAVTVGWILWMMT